MDPLFSSNEQSLEGFVKTERHTIRNVRLTLIEIIREGSALEEESFREILIVTEAVSPSG
jgi:hypothetical protein